MLIDCDCSVDDYDAAVVYRVVERKARKQHACFECRRTIEPGETYEYVSGRWDTGWQSYKTCLGCTRIRKHFCSGGWIFGMLEEMVYECIGFYYTQDDEEDACGQPCAYTERCDDCEDYWLRMRSEGLWDPAVGWTQKGLKEMRK